MWPNIKRFQRNSFKFILYKGGQQYSCVHTEVDDKYNKILNLRFIPDFLQMACEKKIISGRNFYNIRRKLDNNRIVDDVNKNTKTMLAL